VRERDRENEQRITHNASETAWLGVCVDEGEKQGKRESSRARERERERERQRTSEKESKRKRKCGKVGVRMCARVKERD